MYTSTKDLHEAEFKVRLTDDDAELLKLLARRTGIPPAVYLRSIVKQAINSTCGNSAFGESMNGRA